MAYEISIWLLPVLIAVTFHEAAHGFVAHLLGDDTAWRLGRVSFNPWKHIDPIGTILMPAILLLIHSPFLFGYAKPAREFPGAAQSANRHNSGGRRRPWHQSAVGDNRRARISSCGLPASHCGRMGCSKLQERRCYQRRPRDLQFVAAAAARWR